MQRMRFSFQLIDSYELRFGIADCKSALRCHAERDIVIPVLSVCLAVRDTLLQNECTKPIVTLLPISGIYRPRSIASSSYELRQSNKKEARRNSSVL